MDVIKDWLITFTKIILKPVPKTFLEEVEKHEKKFASAVIWIEILVVIIWACSCLNHKEFLLGNLLALIILLPIEFFFFVFCIHSLYKRIYHRKKEHYNELLYIFVAIFVPLLILSSGMVLIPTVGSILSWIVLLYPFILTILAVKSITKLSTMQSIIVVVLGAILGVVGVVTIPILIFGLMNTVPRVF